MEFIIRQKYTKNNGIHPKPNSLAGNFICVNLCVEQFEYFAPKKQQQNNLKTTLALKHTVERKNRKRRVHALIQRMRVVSYLFSLMRRQSMSLTFLFYSTKWNRFIKCICLLSWAICHSGTTRAMFWKRFQTDAISWFTRVREFECFLRFWEYFSQNLLELHNAAIILSHSTIFFCIWKKRAVCQSVKCPFSFFY